MARSIEEISANMKNLFVSDKTIQEAYGLTPGKSFDEQFSKVSIESILIYVSSSCSWLLEQLWNAFSAETEQKVNDSYVTSFPWYHRKALEFQAGDNLIFDEKTYSFKYETTDNNKQIVKNVAVREVTDEGVTKLKIYFSDSQKQPITGDNRTAFEAYIREIGAAGTHYQFISNAPDPIRVHLHIYYDPLVIDSSGTRMDGGGKPVEEAVEKYLNSLEYGGTFYSSKLVDKIQETIGVKDIILEGTTWNGTKENRRKIEAESGAFVYEKNTEDIIYSID